VPETTTTHEISIPLAEGSVSGLLHLPRGATHLYVLAHGAGAGMRHPFLEAMATQLAEQKIGTLRYQFPYMERGRKSPDTPSVAIAAVRAAVARASELHPELPLIAGGKSFGGRMTSQAQAQAALPGVRGLAFLGFPLHAPGKPDTTRGDHLAQVSIPMLFLQGARDDFARLDLITQVCERLSPRATLALVDGADHSFGVRKSAGRTAQEVRDQLCTTLADWARGQS
jgi:predicted alpha/beta-hydrolase family hydrolase